MADTEKKIAEIRATLEKATPGPWKWIDSGGYDRKKLVGEYEIMNFGASMPYSEVAGQEPDDADAHLIANAPEWLRFLLDELDRFEREYAEERAAHNAHVTELCELEQEKRKLREERDKLIEVLRWYADTMIYEYKTSYLDQDAPILDDCGQRARNLLKEIGVTVE